MENSEVRALRRALSSDLTRTINTATNYPEIRLKVLEALEELNERFTELESSRTVSSASSTVSLWFASI